MDVCCTNEKRMSRCEGMDRVSKEDEEARINENLEVIRSYLSVQFNGLSRTRDKSDGSLHHLFTMTDTKSGTQYTLRVTCLKLSDRNNTPEKIRRQLEGDNVAEKMRTGEKGRFSWGP